MGKVNGGQLAVKALKKEGVECVYTLAGGHIDAIIRACIDEDVRIVDVRHEQAATLAAEGWARVTGRPGVALITAGPGVTNGLTGIWNSFECQVPVIIFGGKSPLAEFDLGSLQSIDTQALTNPVTKWGRMGYETRRIPEYVSMAYRQALSGRPGPVYLEFPWDVLETNMVEEGEVVFPANYRTDARPQGDPALVKKAVELILGAKRPLVIAGSGVWWSHAEKELKEFIELIKAPLVLTQMARGAVPEDHPLCFGPTRVGTREADVVLMLGARLDYSLNFGRPGLFGKEGKWIQIDIAAEEIGRNRPIDVGVTGDARAVLGQMIEEARDGCKGRQELPWAQECMAYVKRRQEALETDMQSNSVPIHPARLCREMRDFVDRDATIVMDGGDCTVWGASVLKAYEPGHWLDNGPTGALGVGLPFAMAAKVARPDKQVVLLMGDGSFGLNGMEFDTLVRHNLPVVCVLCNDELWGMVLHDRQRRGDNRDNAMRLGYKAYHKTVESLGGYGVAVERPEEIRTALEEAFASGKPACINARCLSVQRGAPAGRPPMQC